MHKIKPLLIIVFTLFTASCEIIRAPIEKGGYEENIKILNRDLFKYGGDSICNFDRLMNMVKNSRFKYRIIGIEAGTLNTIKESLVNTFEKIRTDTSLTGPEMELKLIEFFTNLFNLSLREKKVIDQSLWDKFQNCCCPYPFCHGPEK